jgi:hypothetical protein
MRTAHGVLFQGQAAGTAAAQVIKDGVSPRNVDMRKLQATLKADGVDPDDPGLWRRLALCSQLEGQTECAGSHHDDEFPPAFH